MKMNLYRIVLLCMNKADFYAVVHRQKILKKKNSNKSLLSAYIVSLDIIYFSLPLLVMYLTISKYTYYEFVIKLFITLGFNFTSDSQISNRCFMTFRK